MDKNKEYRLIKGITWDKLEKDLERTTIENVALYFSDYFEPVTELPINELLIIRNFLDAMPKSYRKRNTNAQVVYDILLKGTSKCGGGSCCDKCRELGIDWDSYEIDFSKNGGNNYGYNKYKRTNKK